MPMPMPRFTVTLRPGLGVVSADDQGDITRLPLARALSAGRVALPDLRGRRALGIVGRSLEHEVERVHSAVFDPERRVYAVTVSAGAPLRALRAALRRNYGAKAADTWMEGDIRLRPLLELHLALVSVVAVARRPA